MYAKIDRDYLFRPGQDEPEWNRVGATWGKREDAAGDVVRFRALDDDRIPYYGGEADDDALEIVYEWALHDAGATILQTRNAAGEWEDVIG